MSPWARRSRATLDTSTSSTPRKWARTTLATPSTGAVHDGCSRHRALGGRRASATLGVLSAWPVCPSVLLNCCCPSVLLNCCCPSDLLNCCCPSDLLNCCCPSVLLNCCCPSVLLIFLSCGTWERRSLYFGEAVPGQVNPLDGREAIASEGAGVFSYFMKIVPTRYYDGNEYASSVVQASQVMDVHDHAGAGGTATASVLADCHGVHHLR